MTNNNDFKSLCEPSNSKSNVIAMRMNQSKLLRGCAIIHCLYSLDISLEASLTSDVMSGSYPCSSAGDKKSGKRTSAGGEKLGDSGGEKARETRRRVRRKRAGDKKKRKAKKRGRTRPINGMPKPSLNRKSKESCNFNKSHM